LRIFCIGDIVGRPGRRALEELLPQLKVELGIDFTIANGENVAGGLGLTPDTAQGILESGVDVITTGNHVWAQKDIIPFLDSDMPLLRPHNFPPGVPGKGYLIRGDVVVVNLIGQTFMGSFDCPFRTMDRLLLELGDMPRAIVVDFHAEATSEKVALGRYLDGRVTAVMGTHTHVGTIDVGLLPRGTAYVTDIGMTGPVNSVIGDDVDEVINRFLTKIPQRLSVGKGKSVLNGIVFEVTAPGVMPVRVQRIQREVA
jgi:2',3'-cyclic-nucleotide 2'-phosphodiesterase